MVRLAANDAGSSRRLFHLRAKPRLVRRDTESGGTDNPYLALQWLNGNRPRHYRKQANFLYRGARRHVRRGRAFYRRFNGCGVLGYNRRQVLFLHSNQHLDAGLYPAMPSSPADNRGDVWRWWSSGSGYLAVFLVIRQRDCRTIERHSNLDAFQYGRLNPHHNLDSQLRYHKLHRNKHLRFSGVCRWLLPDFGQV